MIYISDQILADKCENVMSDWVSAGEGLTALILTYLGRLWGMAWGVYRAEMFYIRSVGERAIYVGR